MQHEAPVPRRPLPVALVFAPIAIAAVLIFAYLFRSPIWADEAYSIDFARLPWPQMAQGMQHLDASFVFYYLLIRYLTFDTPTLNAARVISAVAALPTIPLVYAIGTLLFGRRVGIVASLLIATNFLFLSEARDARMYSILLSVELAAWLALLQYVRFGGWPALVALTVLDALSLWLHPLATVDVATQLLVVLLLYRRSFGPVIAGAVVAAATTIPLILLAHHAGASQIAWLKRPTPTLLWFQLVDANGGTVPAVLGVLLVLASIVIAARNASTEIRTALIWLVTPIVLAFAISFTVQPVFVARYIIETVPPAALLIAWCLCVGVRQPVRYAAVAVLVVAFAVAVDHLYKNPRMQWNRLEPELAAHARAGDPIIIAPAGVDRAYDLELASKGFIAARNLRVIYPSAAEPIWADGLAPSTVSSSYRQIWLLTVPAGDEPATTLLERHYVLASRVLVRGLLLQRFVAK